MADFISDEDKIQTWKYTLSEFTLLYPGKTYDIPTERLTGFSIENDYEKNLFPIMKVSMTIEPSVYKEMLQYKNDIKIKMRLQKFYTLAGSEEKSLLRDSFNTTFSLILDDEYLDPDRSAKVTAENNTGEKSPDENALDYTQSEKTEFNLYKVDMITAMRTMQNTVLTGVTMVGSIAYIAAVCKMDKILLSPLENNTNYPELLLPPQTALSTLQYLDTEYGFYRSGSMIFFGIDRGYILNFKGGCNVYEKDEIKETCFLVPNRGGKYGSAEGGLEKPDQTDKRNYLVFKTDNVSPKDNSVSNDVVQGNSATIINTNTNTITTAGTAGGGNSNVINTNSSNPWLGETYAAQKAADKKVISVSGGSFDMDAITPNKKFTFLFEDTKNTETYRGTYMLTYSGFKFTKNGSDLDLDASMTFKISGGETSVSSESIAAEESES